MMSKKTAETPTIILISLFIFLFNGCNLTDNIIVKKFDDSNVMYVYTNGQNYVTAINTDTYAVKKTFDMKLQSGFTCSGFCMSTNNDFFIFNVDSHESNWPQYILSYDIQEDKINSLFKTGLNNIGAARMGAAMRNDKPGLFYFYSHLNGLYSIDFNEEKIKDTYFQMKDQSGYRVFYPSPDKKWLAELITYGGNSYDELYFYRVNNGLLSPDFILNKDNKESIAIDDIEFSGDMKKIYFSYRLSGDRGRMKDSYYGSYDLETKEFHKFPLSIPWSLCPYYLAYSKKRNELYSVGTYNALIIIDITNEKIKKILKLDGKTEDCSELALRKDENVLFISAVNANLIYVIDLNEDKIINTIPLKSPYFLVIP